MSEQSDINRAFRIGDRAVTTVAEHAALIAEIAELKADHSATFREGMLGIREGTKALLGVGAERDEARAVVEGLKRWNARLTTERGDLKVEAERLTRETLRLERVIGNMAETHRRSRATLAERDATIERLWAQLNEATNVPDAASPTGGLETSSGWSGPIRWADDQCPACYRPTHQGTCR